MSHRAILKYLDNPIRIISVSVNDLIGYIAPFIIGGICDSLFIVPITGLFSIYLLKRFLKKYPRYYFIRYLYWAFPTVRYNKLFQVDLPDSSKRMWVK